MEEDSSDYIQLMNHASGMNYCVYDLYLQTETALRFLFWIHYSAKQFIQHACHEETWKTDSKKVIQD